MGSNSSEIRPVFVGIGISTYDHNPPFEDLSSTTELRALSQTLSDLGFVVAPMPENGDSSAIRSALQRWVKSRQADRGGAVFAVWSGHAVPRTSGPGLDLVTRETDNPITPSNSIPPENLAADLAECRADQILLIIDTCYSGKAVLPAVSELGARIQPRSFAPGHRPWIGVLASSLGYERARDGLLSAYLLEMLSKGPTTSAGRARWAINNDAIRGVDLIDALVQEWPHEDQQLEAWANFVISGAFFPNPLFRPAQSEQLVAESIRLDQPTAVLTSAAAFTGRKRAVQSIIDWMGKNANGIYVLLGSAGAGKSAVLDRLVALSDPQQRQHLSESVPGIDPAIDPGENAITVLVRANGRTLPDFLSQIGHAVGLSRPLTVEQLVPFLSGRSQVVTIAIDGLEASGQGQAFEIAHNLIRPLSGAARFIVATRDLSRTLPGLDGEDHHETLLEALGPGIVVDDLDQDPELSQDIADFVTERLTSGVWAHQASAAREVGDRVARLASKDTGSFRFASELANVLSTRRIDVGGEFSQELETVRRETARLDLGSGPELVRNGRRLRGGATDLLTALAFALGVGLPTRGVWEAVATALSAKKRRYIQVDVDWVLVNYGQYIVEGGDDGQAVYRLYRGETAAELRQSARDREPDQAIARGLIRLARDQVRASGGSKRVNPYLLNNLAYYVVRGGPTVLPDYDAFAAEVGAPWPRQLPMALAVEAAREREAGRPATARKLALEAVRRFEALVTKDPDENLQSYAGTLNELALDHAYAGDLDEAIKTLQQAVEVYRKLAAARPPAFRATLAGALYNVGRMRLRRSEWALALEPLKESVDLIDSLGPRHNLYAVDFADRVYCLGLAYFRAGQYVLVLEPTRRASELYRQAISENVDKSHELAESLNVLSAALGETGDTGGAIEAGLESLRVQVKRLRFGTGAVSDLDRTLKNIVITSRLGQSRTRVHGAITEALDALGTHSPGAVVLHRALADLAGDSGSVTNAVTEETKALDVAIELNDERSVRDICEALYRLYSAKPEEVKKAWVAARGSKLPRWITLDTPRADSLYQWLQHRTVEEFEKARDQLLSTRTIAALDQMADLTPIGIDARTCFLAVTTMRAHPELDYPHAMDGAHITAVMMVWILVASTGDAEAFVEQHRTDIMSDRAKTILRTMSEADPSERRIWYARGLLGLVGEVGVREAVSCAKDPERLWEMWANAECNGYLALYCSWLMLAYRSAEHLAVGWAEVALANVCAGDESQAEWAIRVARSFAPEAQLAELRTFVAKAAEDYPERRQTLERLGQLLLE